MILCMTYYETIIKHLFWAS